MGVSVRAVYQEGQLRLLEPVDLVEGQMVDITIRPNPPQAALTPGQVDARLRSAGVLLVDVGVMEEGVELSRSERQRIGALFAGERSSADLIDEDRGLY